MCDLLLSSRFSHADTSNKTHWTGCVMALSLQLQRTCRQGLDAIAALVHTQVAALTEHDLVRLHGVPLSTDGTQRILITSALLSKHIPHHHLQRRGPGSSANHYLTTAQAAGVVSHCRNFS